MDSVRGPDDQRGHEDYDRDGIGNEPDRGLSIGTDERRMHVRAYNFWVSLLKGRPYPAIDDLDVEHIPDFGPHSVLLDFSSGVNDPAINFLGDALRKECGVTSGISRVADVPSRSLLSRLTDHYLQIIANRAPIGFEAEFVSQRGHNTMYRGILMPFSSTGESIDFIYGVINWKELVDAGTQAQLDAEVAEARRSVATRPMLTAPVWADGPSSGMGDDTLLLDTPAPAEGNEVALPGAALGVRLADQLAMARETAASVRAADTRSRAALYRALGRAFDFALAAEADVEGYARLLAQAELTPQMRAPMTPIVKLVFGIDHDKARLTEFAAVLSHARRTGVSAGGFATFIDGFEGGMKGIVRAERDVRRPAAARSAATQTVRTLREAKPLAAVALDAGGEEFVLLLARASDAGKLDVVARVDGEKGLLQQAMRRAAA